MDHLDDVSVEALQEALDRVEGTKPTQRLIAAIAYKHGVTQTELAEWFDVQRRTIYSWLKRLEEEPLEEAVRDDRRSGRPRKLSEDQRQQLERTLQQPPTDVGYEAPAWTPPLVREHLRDTFDVNYSLPSCRRLMKEAGLKYERKDRSTDEARSDEEPHEIFEQSDGRWVPE